MSETQLATRPRASHQLAQFIGMEPGVMLDTIKAQCFKGNPANISNEQLAAFVSIANEMQVNPLLPGMLYAYPIQGGGIVPMMGPDGIFKKLAEHPEIENWETEVFPADVMLPPTHAISKIFRKGRERPITYTAVFSEWKIGSNPNWNSRPRHMLALRALKHCARQIIHGIPFDEDERTIMGEINVTPSSEAQHDTQVEQRATAPKRSRAGAAPVISNPEPKIEKAEKAKEIVVDAEVVDKTEVIEKAPIKDEVKAELKKENPTPQQQQSVVSRAFLKDGELAVLDCEVIDISTMMGKYKGVPTPLVQAQLKGGFVGSVIHFDGATKQGADLVPDPLYKPAGKARFHLRGKINQVNQKMTTLVEKIEALSETPTVDME